MKGYVFAYNGKYNFLNLQVGKTYEMVGVSKDSSMVFQFYADPDIIFLPGSYVRGKTKIFKIKPLGDVKKSYVTTYTNKFSVLEEVKPTDYNKIFKNYVFDDEYNLIEDKSENKTFEFTDGRLCIVKISGNTDSTQYYNEKGCLTHYDGINYQEWYEYDEKNRLVHFKDSIVSEEFYQYDENDKLIHVKTLPSNNEYTHTYDDRGNLILQKDSLGHETYAQYDSNNNLINYKTINGDEFSRKYDKDNNLIDHEEKNPSECFKIIIK